MAVVIQMTSLSGGHSGCRPHKTAFKTMLAAPAAIRYQPAARFAGYQISGADIVFGVRKPYHPFGGTAPNTMGTASTIMNTGIANPAT